MFAKSVVRVGVLECTIMQPELHLAQISKLSSPVLISVLCELKSGGLEWLGSTVHLKIKCVFKAVLNGILFGPEIRTDS